MNILISDNTSVLRIFKYISRNAATDAKSKLNNEWFVNSDKTGQISEYSF